MKLNRNSIEKTIEELSLALERGKLTKHNRLKTRLLVEEVLLRYLENGFENADFSCKVSRRFREWKVVISIEGEEQDCVREFSDGRDMEYYDIVSSMLAIDDCSASYRYKKGQNSITFRTEHRPEKESFFSKNQILIYALAGILLSAAAKLLFHDASLLFVEHLTSPLNRVLLDLLKTVTVYYVFTSLICGIIAMEDIRRLSTVGVKTILRFVFVSALMILFSIGVCFLFFSTSGTRGTEFELKTVLDMLLNIIPVNPLESFLSRNTIQIIVIGFLIGAAILVSGDKLKGLSSAAYEGKELFGFLMKLVTNLIPLMVALSIFNLIVTTETTALGSIWKCIVSNIAIGVIFAALCVAGLCVRYRQSLHEVWNKIRPAVMLGLATGSSSITIPKLCEVTRKGKGKESSLESYWIPLSFSLFSPSSIFALVVYVFFAAEREGIAVTPAMLLLMFLLILEIGIATPKIPGGIMATVALLLTELGIGSDSIGLIMAANVFVVNIDSAVGTVVRGTELLRAELLQKR